MACNTNKIAQDEAKAREHLSKKAADSASIFPDWTKKTAPFYFSPNKTYYVPVKTQYTKYIDQSDLNNIMQSAIIPGCEKLLRHLSKLVLVGTVDTVANSAIARDYFIETRPLVGKIKVLVAIPEAVMDEIRNLPIGIEIPDAVNAALDISEEILTDTTSFFHSAEDSVHYLNNLFDNLEDPSYYKNNTLFALDLLSKTETFKDIKQKVVEDSHYSDEIKEVIARANTRNFDFVGDEVFNQLLTGKGQFNSIDDIYEFILNKVDTQTLIELVLQCLWIPTLLLPELKFKIPRLPEIPTIDWPDNLPILDYLKWLARAIMEAIIAIIAAIVTVLIQELLEELREFCENTRDSMQHNVMNIVDMLFQKPSQHKKFFDDLSMVTTPRELAGMLDDDMSDELLEATLLLPSSPFNNKQEVRDLFGELSKIADKDLITRIQNQPWQALESICQTHQGENNMRKALISRDFSKEQIEEELDRERTRRQDRVNQYAKFLSNEGTLNSFLPPMVGSDPENSIVPRMFGPLEHTIKKSILPIFDSINSTFITELRDFIDKLSNEDTTSYVQLQNLSRFFNEGTNLQINPPTILFEDLNKFFKEGGNISHKDNNIILEGTTKLIYSMINNERSGTILSDDFFVTNNGQELFSGNYIFENEQNLEISAGLPAQAEAFFSFVNKILKQVSPGLDNNDIKDSLFEGQKDLLVQILGSILEQSSSSLFFNRVDGNENVKFQILSIIIFRWLIEGKQPDGENIFNFSNMLQIPFIKAELLEKYKTLPLEEGEGFGELLQRVSIEQFDKTLTNVQLVDILLKSMFLFSEFDPQVLSNDAIFIEFLKSRVYSDSVQSSITSVTNSFVTELQNYFLPRDIFSVFLKEICPHFDVPRSKSGVRLAGTKIHKDGGFIIEQYLRIVDNPENILTFNDREAFDVVNINEWQEYLDILPFDIDTYFSEWKFGYRISYVAKYQSELESGLIALANEDNYNTSKATKENAFEISERITTPGGRTEDRHLFVLPLISHEENIEISFNAMRSVPRDFSFVGNLVTAENFNFLFQYCFPLQRLLSLATIYSVKAFDEKFPYGTFINTKKVANNAKQSMICSQTYDYEPEL